MYAEAVHQQGAPLKNCFGLIDGTVVAHLRGSAMTAPCYRKLISLTTCVGWPIGDPLCLYGDPAYPFGVHLQPHLGT